MTKHVYETILARLRAYSTDPIHLFDELNDIDAQLTIGISQTKTCWMLHQVLLLFQGI